MELKWKQGKQFGVLALRRHNLPNLSTNNLQHSKMTGKIQFILGFLLITLTLGCASKKGFVSETDYLSLLPQEAEIYLRFPVSENQELANGLVSSLIPYMENKEIQKLTGRFTTIYGAVKNKEFSALATGAFPKAGLGFVLTKKNGWQKIKDKNIPITGAYYRYSGFQSSKGKPYQIAFPSSSMVMVAPEVKKLLTSLHNQQEGLDDQDEKYQVVSSQEPVPLGNLQDSGANPLAEFTSSDISNNAALTFYVADITAAVMPFLKTRLSINLPVKDMFGEFLPVEVINNQEDAGIPQEQLYLFTGYIGLADSRAMRPAQTALNILFRSLGLDSSGLRYTVHGEKTIVISGIIVPNTGLISLIKKVIK